VNLLPILFEGVLKDIRPIAENEPKVPASAIAAEVGVIRVQAHEDVISGKSHINET